MKRTSPQAEAVQNEACLLLLVMPELMLSNSLALCSLMFPDISSVVLYTICLFTDKLTLRAMDADAPVQNCNSRDRGVYHPIRQMNFYINKATALQQSTAVLSSQHGILTGEIETRRLLNLWGPLQCARKLSIGL